MSVLETVSGRNTAKGIFSARACLHSMEVVVMVGIPGSGKTTLARKKFPNHTHISLDANRGMLWIQRRSLLERYKTEEQAPDGLSHSRKVEYVMVHDALLNGESVVIDNTNVTAEIRRTYIRLARMCGARILAIYFANTRHAYQRNAGRAAKPGEECLEDSVLDKFRDALEPPDASEGFHVIYVVE